MSEPTDSPVDWVKQHLARYVASDGADGQLWRGVPTLLLTVTGRSSGATRRTALIYAVDGDDVIVVASKGGADEHPQWYFNLQADPDVRVQVGPRRYAATARTPGPDERDSLWALAAAVFPTYQEYRAPTAREIPVVVLSPA